MSDIVRVLWPSSPVPYSLHILLTTKCSLGCPDCYYRDTLGSWPFSNAMILITEAAQMGVQWLALGGGEPTEWDGLVELIDYARELGLRIAVTTNGTNLLPINADRIHVSHDTMHKTSRQDVLNAVDFYKSRGAEVGLNVIADDLDFVMGLPFQEVAQVVLLLPKPYKQDDGWLNCIHGVIDHIHQNRLAEVLVDACLGRLLTGRHCMQGRSSMSLDQLGRASVCSNVSHKYLTPNLQEGWEAVRVRGDALQTGCIIP